VDGVGLATTVSAVVLGRFDADASGAGSSASRGRFLAKGGGVCSTLRGNSFLMASLADFDGRLRSSLALLAVAFFSLMVITLLGRAVDSSSLSTCWAAAFFRPLLGDSGGVLL
jgi:hypothetical protein